jgi:hypothetical protein
MSNSGVTVDTPKRELELRQDASPDELLVSQSIACDKDAFPLSTTVTTIESFQKEDVDVKIVPGDEKTDDTRSNASANLSKKGQRNKNERDYLKKPHACRKHARETICLSEEGQDSSRTGGDGSVKGPSAQSKVHGKSPARARLAIRNRSRTPSAQHFKRKQRKMSAGGANFVSTIEESETAHHLRSEALAEKSGSAGISLERKGVIDKLDATTRVCVGQSPESMTTNHNATPSHVVMTDDEDLTLNSCKNPESLIAKMDERESRRQHMALLQSAAALNDRDNMVQRDVEVISFSEPSKVDGHQATPCSIGGQHLEIGQPQEGLSLRSAVDAPNETNAHTSAAQPVKDVNNAFETREELLPNEKSLERLSNTSSIHVSAGTQEASFTAPSWPFAPEATRPAAHQDAEVSTINKQANLDAVDRAPSEKRSPSGRDDKKHDSNTLGRQSSKEVK